MKVYKNTSRIRLPGKVPRRLYYKLNLAHPIELPFFDEGVWMTKEQMSLIFDTNSHRISTCCNKVLKGLHEAEVNFTKYFPTYNYGQKSRDIFYRLDLTLLIGKIINSNGYINFKSWTKIHLRY